MMNDDNYIIHISKWLNNFVNENKINIEDMSKKLDCSTGYINVLLDYSKHLDIYKEQNINVSIEFIVRLATAYNIKIDEILLCDL